MEGAKKVANPVVLEVNSRFKHVNAWIIWCDPNVSNVTTLSCRLKGAANWAKNVWIQLLNFTPLPFTLVTFVLEQIQIRCQGSMLSFGCLRLIFGGPKRGVQEEDLQSVALAK